MPPNLSSVSLSTLLSHALHLISSLSTPAYFPVPILQCWSTSLPFRDADSGCPGWRSQDLLCAVPPHTAPSSSHRYQYRDHSALSAAESGPVTLFGSHCLLYSTLFYSLPHSSKCEATLSVSCTAARFIFTSITYLQLIFSPHLSVSLIPHHDFLDRGTCPPIICSTHFFHFSLFKCAHLLVLHYLL